MDTLWFYEYFMDVMWTLQNGEGSNSVHTAKVLWWNYHQWRRLLINLQKQITPLAGGAPSLAGTTQKKKKKKNALNGLGAACY